MGQQKNATTHASLILAGSWLGDNEHDTGSLSGSLERTFRDIERSCNLQQLPEGPWIHRDVEMEFAFERFV